MYLLSLLDFNKPVLNLVQSIITLYTPILTTLTLESRFVQNTENYMSSNIKVNSELFAEGRC